RPSRRARCSPDPSGPAANVRPGRSSFNPVSEDSTMNAIRQEIQQEALGRAVAGQSMANWVPIIAGFTAKGIPADQIKPSENVFTYHAWRALGRQVRRGEHGVRVSTFVTCRGKEDGTATNDADGADKPQ